MCHTRTMRNTLMLLLLCAAGFAQQPGTLDPAKDPAKLEKVEKAEKDKAEQEVTFHSRTDLMIAPTTVLNKHGDYVNGLQPQDFQLYDNNKLQQIQADVHDQPLSLVIAVQKSSNLNEILPKIQRIGSLLKDLIAGEDGETAIIAFDHNVVVAQDFTNDTGQITETMKKLKPGSSQHAVDDAVMKGIGMLKNRPKDRRRILLLIAERRDKGSGSRVREVLEEAVYHATRVTVNRPQLKIRTRPGYWVASRPDQ